MYFKHFSRQYRQQWQHLNPHFTRGFLVCVSLNFRSIYLSMSRYNHTNSIIERTSCTMAMISDPKATEPRWYVSTQQKAWPIVKRVTSLFSSSFLKYHFPTVPATTMTPIALMNPDVQNHMNRCQKARTTSPETEPSTALDSSVQFCMVSGSSQTIAVAFFARVNSCNRWYEYSLRWCP